MHGLLGNLVGAVLLSHLLGAVLAADVVDSSRGMQHLRPRSHQAAHPDHQWSGERTAHVLAAAKSLERHLAAVEEHPFRFRAVRQEQLKQLKGLEKKVALGYSHREYKGGPPVKETLRLLSSLESAAQNEAVHDEQERDQAQNDCKLKLAGLQGNLDIVEQQYNGLPDEAKAKWESHKLESQINATQQLVQGLERHEASLVQSERDFTHAIQVLEQRVVNRTASRTHLYQLVDAVARRIRSGLTNTADFPDENDPRRIGGGKPDPDPENPKSLEESKRLLALERNRRTDARSFPATAKGEKWQTVIGMGEVGNVQIPPKPKVRKPDPPEEKPDWMKNPPQSLPGGQGRKTAVAGPAEESAEGAAEESATVDPAAAAAASKAQENVAQAGEAQTTASALPRESGTQQLGDENAMNDALLLLLEVGRGGAGGLRRGAAAADAAAEPVAPAEIASVRQIHGQVNTSTAAAAAAAAGGPGAANAMVDPKLIRDMQADDAQTKVVKLMDALAIVGDKALEVYRTDVSKEKTNVLALRTANRARLADVQAKLGKRRGESQKLADKLKAFWFHYNISLPQRRDLLGRGERIKDLISHKKAWCSLQEDMYKKQESGRAELLATIRDIREVAQSKASELRRVVEIQKARIRTARAELPFLGSPDETEGLARGSSATNATAIALGHGAGGENATAVASGDAPPVTETDRVSTELMRLLVEGGMQGMVEGGDKAKVRGGSVGQTVPAKKPFKVNESEAVMEGVNNTDVEQLVKMGFAPQNRTKAMVRVLYTSVGRGAAGGGGGGGAVFGCGCVCCFSASGLCKESVLTQHCVPPLFFRFVAVLVVLVAFWFAALLMVCCCPRWFFRFVGDYRRTCRRR